MSKGLKVHLALFSAALIYAASFSIAKAAMPAYILPFAFIALRVATATVLFWAIGPWVPKTTIERKDIPLLLATTLFGVGLNMIFFFKGLETSAPISSAVIMVTTPLFVLLIAAFMKAEKLTLLKWVGIVLGTTGAVLLILNKPYSATVNDSVLGNLYIMLNAISYAVYLVLVKPLMVKYNPLVVSKWQFLAANLIMIPLGYNQLQNIAWPTIPLPIWGAILFVLIGTTFLTYLLNSYALSHANPSLVGSYIYLQPVLTTLIAIAVGTDMLTLNTIVYSFMIFVGVWLISERAIKKKAVFNQ